MVGGNWSEANGINDVGQIVGVSAYAVGDNLAVMWDSVNGIQDLNDLLPSNSGWVLKEAEDINVHGQIVGIGQYNGNSRAFLLNPTVVPEPISSILFITGGVALGVRTFLKSNPV